MEPMPKPKKPELTINDVPDKYLEVVARELSMSTPWQYDPDEAGYRDPDTGQSSAYPDKDDSATTRSVLQEQCFVKATRNPQVATATKGLVGRLTGFGFETSSEIQQIQDVIEEIELDPRNRLYNYWPKYVGRGKIEGELFLCLTCHTTGFIEVDFIDPSAIESSQEESGIIFHPTKTTTPLIYCIKDDENGVDEQIPSIFIARYPEWLEYAKQSQAYSSTALKNSKSGKKVFKKMGGFNRFIVAWDQGYITRRNIGHIRTVLEWVQYYEDIKKYELDHKKSAGAYVWIVNFTDVKSWIQWLKMSDADRQKTGIAAKKTPGGTMVLGPNMEMKASNPNLPNISDSDSDIMAMVTSGLNEESGVTTGQSTGTFASVKESRGPMSDRTSDEIAYFERFLRYDFWGSIFFLRSQVTAFPEFFNVEEAVAFKPGKSDGESEPIFKKVKKHPEAIIDINFPTSEINDMESRARSLFGVKHSDLSDTAGIPKSELVKKLGYANYPKMRLQYETEKRKYPELPMTVDAESIQESQQAEPARKKVKDDGKGSSKEKR